MSAVAKIDSNVTGLQYAKETTIGVLPGTPDWYVLEPNSYKGFGFNTKTTARQPISSTRELQKGVLTDLDAMADWENDLSPGNLQDILQSFFFAALRTKNEYSYALGNQPSVTATGTYTVPSGGTGYVANALLFAKGWANAANNGLKVVASSTATTVVVTPTGMVNESAGPGIISRVGVIGATGDITMTNSGSAYPVLGATALNFTTLGLTPGEWIFIGGDAVGDKFATAANNGFARIYSISATQIVLDRTANTTVTDTGTGKTIRLFFGRVLKNEAALASQLRTTYTLERQLGAPDNASPAQIQAEYITGAVADQLAIHYKTASKMVVDLSFKGNDETFNTGPTGPKSGNRKPLIASQAFNTSSDVHRAALVGYSATDANPGNAFAFVTDATITIKNNIKPLKAIGVLGAFEQNAGFFEVDVALTAYFQNVTSLTNIRNNVDTGLDIQLVNSNAGVTIDVPTLALQTKGVDAKINEPLLLPINGKAGTYNKDNTNADHTTLMMFWDYLPNAA